MHDLLHRLAVALLAGCGLATLAAGAILTHDARREARWNLGRRQEG